MIKKTSGSGIKNENISNKELTEENNDKDPKFKVGDIVRMSKHKNIFAKGCVPNWS